MALHSALPIYKQTYDLLVMVIKFAANMPRDFKHAIGGRIRDECIELTTLIGRANKVREKVPHIDGFLEHLQVVEMLVRLSRDERLISTGQYAKAVELTTSIGKQASGWRNHSAASPVA